ncbi:unnamed protein product [Amoebophrya sp. A25]|nr:unnamed protein product [Amoebophrya sp. A25]|eukprot:GSA25T00013059001.1
MAGGECPISATATAPALGGRTNGSKKTKTGDSDGSTTSKSKAKGAPSPNKKVARPRRIVVEYEAPPQASKRAESREKRQKLKEQYYYAARARPADGHQREIAVAGAATFKQKVSAERGVSKSSKDKDVGVPLADDDVPLPANNNRNKKGRPSSAVAAYIEERVKNGEAIDSNEVERIVRAQMFRETSSNEDQQKARCEVQLDAATEPIDKKHQEHDVQDSPIEPENATRHGPPPPRASAVAIPVVDIDPAEQEEEADDHIKQGEGRELFPAEHDVAVEEDEDRYERSGRENRSASSEYIAVFPEEMSTQEMAAESEEQEDQEDQEMNLNQHQEAGEEDEGGGSRRHSLLLDESISFSVSPAGAGSECEGAEVGEGAGQRTAADGKNSNKVYNLFHQSCAQEAAAALEEMYYRGSSHEHYGMGMHSHGMPVFLYAKDGDGAAGGVQREAGAPGDLRRGDEQPAVTPAPLGVPEGDSAPVLSSSAEVPLTFQREDQELQEVVPAPQEEQGLPSGEELARLEVDGLNRSAATGASTTGGAGGARPLGTSASVGPMGTMAGTCGTSTRRSPKVSLRAVVATPPVGCSTTGKVFASTIPHYQVHSPDDDLRTCIIRDYVSRASSPDTPSYKGIPPPDPHLNDDQNVCRGGTSGYFCYSPKAASVKRHNLEVAAHHKSQVESSISVQERASAFAPPDRMSSMSMDEANIDPMSMRESFATYVPGSSLLSAVQPRDTNYWSDERRRQPQRRSGLGSSGGGDGGDSSTDWTAYGRDGQLLSTAEANAKRDKVRPSLHSRSSGSEPKRVVSKKAPPSEVGRAKAAAARGATGVKAGRDASRSRSGSRDRDGAAAAQPGEGEEEKAAAADPKKASAAKAKSSENKATSAVAKKAGSKDGAKAAAADKKATAASKKAGAAPPTAPATKKEASPAKASAGTKATPSATSAVAKKAAGAKERPSTATSSTPSPKKSASPAKKAVGAPAEEQRPKTAPGAAAPPKASGASTASTSREAAAKQKSAAKVGAAAAAPKTGAKASAPKSTAVTTVNKAAAEGEKAATVASSEAPRGHRPTNLYYHFEPEERIDESEIRRSSITSQRRTVSSGRDTAASLPLDASDDNADHTILDESQSAKFMLGGAQIPDRVDIALTRFFEHYPLPFLQVTKLRANWYFVLDVTGGSKAQGKKVFVDFRGQHSLIVKSSRGLESLESFFAVQRVKHEQTFRGTWPEMKGTLLPGYGAKLPQPQLPPERKTEAYMPSSPKQKADEVFLKDSPKDETKMAPGDLHQHPYLLQARDGKIAKLPLIRGQNGVPITGAMEMRPAPASPQSAKAKKMSFSNRRSTQELGEQILMAYDEDSQFERDAAEFFNPGGTTTTTEVVPQQLLSKKCKGIGKNGRAGRATTPTVGDPSSTAPVLGSGVAAAQGRARRETGVILLASEEVAEGEAATGMRISTGSSISRGSVLSMPPPPDEEAVTQAASVPPTKRMETATRPAQNSNPQEPGRRGSFAAGGVDEVIQKLEKGRGAATGVVVESASPPILGEVPDSPGSASGSGHGGDSGEASVAGSLGRPEDDGKVKIEEGTYDGGDLVDEAARRVAGGKSASSSKRNKDRVTNLKGASEPSKSSTSEDQSNTPPTSSGGPARGPKKTSSTGAREVEEEKVLSQDQEETRRAAYKSVVGDLEQLEAVWEVEHVAKLMADASSSSSESINSETNKNIPVGGGGASSSNNNFYFFADGARAVSSSLGGGLQEAEDKKMSSAGEGGLSGPTSGQFETPRSKPEEAEDAVVVEGQLQGAAMLALSFDGVAGDEGRPANESALHPSPEKLSPAKRHEKNVESRMVNIKTTQIETSGGAEQDAPADLSRSQKSTTGSRGASAGSVTAVSSTRASGKNHVNDNRQKGTSTHLYYVENSYSRRDLQDSESHEQVAAPPEVDHLAGYDEFADMTEDHNTQEEITSGGRLKQRSASADSGSCSSASIEEVHVDLDDNVARGTAASAPRPPSSAGRPPLPEASTSRGGSAIGTRTSREASSTSAGAAVATNASSSSAVPISASVTHRSKQHVVEQEQGVEQVHDQLQQSYDARTSARREGRRGSHSSAASSSIRSVSEYGGRASSHTSLHSNKPLYDRRSPFCDERNYGGSMVCSREARTGSDRQDFTSRSRFVMGGAEPGPKAPIRGGRVRSSSQSGPRKPALQAQKPPPLTHSASTTHAPQVAEHYYTGTTGGAASSTSGNDRRVGNGAGTSSLRLATTSSSRNNSKNSSKSSRRHDERHRSASAGPGAGFWRDENSAGYSHRNKLRKVEIMDGSPHLFVRDYVGETTTDGESENIKGPSAADDQRGKYTTEQERMIVQELLYGGPEDSNKGRNSVKATPQKPKAAPTVVDDEKLREKLRELPFSVHHEIKEEKLALSPKADFRGRVHSPDEIIREINSRGSLRKGGLSNKGRVGAGTTSTASRRVASATHNPAVQASGTNTIGHYHTHHAANSIQEDALARSAAGKSPIRGGQARGVTNGALGNFPFRIKETPTFSQRGRGYMGSPGLSSNSVRALSPQAKHGMDSTHQHLARRFQMDDDEFASTINDAMKEAAKKALTYHMDFQTGKPGSPEEDSIARRLGLGTANDNSEEYLHSRTREIYQQYCVLRPRPEDSGHLQDAIEHGRGAVGGESRFRVKRSNLQAAVGGPLSSAASGGPASMRNAVDPGASYAGNFTFPPPSASDVVLDGSVNLHAAQLLSHGPSQGQYDRHVAKRFPGQLLGTSGAGTGFHPDQHIPAAIRPEDEAAFVAGAAGYVDYYDQGAMASVGSHQHHASAYMVHQNMPMLNQQLQHERS